MTLSVATVAKAIQEVNKKISEWEEAGFPAWREDQTRYGIIDPIISALGWDTAEPKECHVEFPRGENGGRVDYAFFVQLDMAQLQAEGDFPAPDIIVEAKALGRCLDEHFDKLREYVRAYPRMTGGVAVLTNGIEWWLYPVGPRGGLPRELDDEYVVNVKSSPQKAAQELSRRLGRRVQR